MRSTYISEPNSLRKGKGPSVGDRYLRGIKCAPGRTAADLSVEMNKLVNSIVEK